MMSNFRVGFAVVATVLFAGSVQAGPFRLLIAQTKSTCANGQCGKAQAAPAVTVVTPQVAVTVAPTAIPTPTKAAPAYGTVTNTTTVAVGGTGPVREGLAQMKANIQARAGKCFHPGGGFGQHARYEGVGFSSVSPQAAINACCYANSKQPVEVGVARGPRGWHATVLYR